MNLSSTVERAHRLLEALAAPDSPSALTELAQAADLPKATAYRLLQTLRALGYVVQDQDSGYHLGPMLATLGSAYLAKLELPRIAQPILQDLCDQTCETVHLAVLSGVEVVYVSKIESPRTIRMHSRVGTRLPAYTSALGKVLIAYLPPVERNKRIEMIDFVVRTPTTITDPLAFHRHLDEVRTQGYALDNAEGEAGVRCVGAPVRDYTGEVIAAISVAGPEGRVDPSVLIPCVTKAGHALSALLGYRKEGDRT